MELATPAARYLGAADRDLLAGMRCSTGTWFEDDVEAFVQRDSPTTTTGASHTRATRSLGSTSKIVEYDDGKVVAIEVKLGRTPGAREVKHLNWLAKELGDDLLDAVVVTTSSDAYRRPQDQIAVVPAALLGP